MRYTISVGIAFGVIMNVLRGTVFSIILGRSGVGVGIALGVSFACCGCLLGFVIDKNHRDEES